MKLLFISPFVPGENAGHAGGVTTYHFVEGLAALGHEVHLLALSRQMERPLLEPLRQRLASLHTYEIPYRHDPSHLSRIRHFWKIAASILRGIFSRKPIYLVRYDYPGFAELAAELAQSLRPDVVQIEYATLHPLRRVLPPDIPVVLDTHEVRSLTSLRTLQGSSRLLRPFHALELASWIESLAGLEGFARILTVSDADGLAIRAFAPHLPVQTLPQGVDCSQYRPFGQEKKPNSIVYVGSFDHSQNVDTALLLLDRILPAVWEKHPTARLHLVGSHPPPVLSRRAGPRVEIPGFVEDLARHVESREIFVAPLRQGAGIKIKLLQALALGLPVVTTPAGAEGIGLEHEKNALVSPTVEGCVPLVLRLLADPAQRSRLGQAGRQLVETRFHRPVLVKKLEALLEDILEEKRQSAGRPPSGQR